MVVRGLEVVELAQELAEKKTWRRRFGGPIMTMIAVLKQEPPDGRTDDLGSQRGVRRWTKEELGTTLSIVQKILEANALEAPAGT